MHVCDYRHSGCGCCQAFEEREILRLFKTESVHVCDLASGGFCQNVGRSGEIQAFQG